MNNGLVKYVDFHPYDRNGEPLVYIAPEDRDIEKLAGADLHPDLLAYIEANKPPSDHARVIPAAVGVNEFYGPNVNGDGFYEEDMLQTPNGVFYLNEPDRVYDLPIYKTFETHANLFMKHVNRPDSPRYGAIPHAFWNPQMHRIELVVDIDRNLAIRQAENIDRGILPGFSMGFRCIPADRCSVCGNEASTRAAYCYHLSHQLGHVLEGEIARLAGVADGHIVHARNFNGYFFDFSMVDRPADHIAWGMKKVATFNGVSFQEEQEKVAATLLDELSDKYSHMIRSELFGNKEADIIKEVPDVPTATEAVHAMEQNSPRTARIVLRFRPRELDLNSLIQMSNRYPAHTIASTMGQKGIMLTPMEFQTIILNRMGHGQAAAEAHKADACFADEVDMSKVTPVVNDMLDPGHEIIPSEKLGQMIDDIDDGAFVMDRDVRPRAMVKRILHVKEGAAIPSPFTSPYPSAPVSAPSATGAMTQILVNAGVTGGGNTDRYIASKPEGATTVDKHNPIIPLSILAGMFLASNLIASKSALLKGEGHLWKVPAAAGAGLLASIGIGRMGIEKESSVAAYASDPVLQTMLGVGASYGFARRADKKRAQGIQPNMAEEVIEKHPLLSGLAGVVTLRSAVGVAKKLLNKTGEMHPEHVDMYEDATLIRIIEGV